MSRSRKSDTIKPWLSARGDCKEGRFIQAGNSFMLSGAVHGLTDGAKWTYLSMCMECGGRRDFKFPLSAASKYGISSSSLRRHINELKKKGFIKVGSNANLRKPNDYCFSLEWRAETKTPQTKP